MALTLNTNVASLNAQRNLGGSSSALETSLQRLSSGQRINSAKDDAAGLQISNRLTSQIRGLGVAARNANDGISLAQTAEGALQESTNILQRMRDLALQSANGSNNGTDRAALQKEVSQLKSELNRIAETTSFGAQKLLDGTFGTQTFQVGAQANETINLSTGNASGTAIGSQRVTANGTLNVAVAAGATAAAAANPVLAGEDLTVAGTLGSKTIDVAVGSSARTIATQVNAQSTYTGVNAEALTQATLSNLTETGTYSFTLGGESTATISVNVTAVTDLSGLADAINKESAKTGISAIAEGGTVTLKSTRGDDITIENFAAADGSGAIDLRGQNGFTGANTGAAAITLSGATASVTDSSRVGGTLRFNSSSAYTVTSAQAAAATNGLFTTATANASSLDAVSTVDVGTAAGASNAIGIIDGAVASIDNIRAGLGAVQNRFTSTISNLNSIAENVSASRSRIVDTDFAAETASLSRNQVLQQAGTAILAQANQLSQNVLSLLR